MNLVEATVYISLILLFLAVSMGTYQQKNGENPDMFCKNLVADIRLVKSYAENGESRAVIYTEQDGERKVYKIRKNPGEIKEVAIPENIVCHYFYIQFKRNGTAQRGESIRIYSKKDKKRKNPYTITITPVTGRIWYYEKKKYSKMQY